MKKGDRVFVRMAAQPRDKRAKPCDLWWPGRAAGHVSGMVTVAFDNPWRDGTTEVTVPKGELG